MSRASLRPVLGECSVSIPNIGDSERTSSNLTGFLPIGTIPSGAKTVDLRITRSSSAYNSGWGASGYDTITDLSIPVSTSSNFIWRISNHGNFRIMYGNPSSPSDTPQEVICWVIGNSNGYLVISGVVSGGNDRRRIFVPYPSYAPFSASIHATFYG